jgi:riboflavin kinase / FMN adenylyltransferase
MQVLNRFPIPVPSLRPVVTIGHFDGIHLGHQALIQAIVSRAREAGVPAILVTVSPHPDEVSLERWGFYLTSDRERLGLIEQMGVDQVVVLPLTQRWRQPDPWQWMRWLKQQSQLLELWLGPGSLWDDLSEGETSRLQRAVDRNGFTLHRIPPVCLNGHPISSGQIRAAIREGDIHLANASLGRPYPLQGYLLQQDPPFVRSKGAILSVIFNGESVIPKAGLYICQVRYRAQCQYAPVYFDDRLSQSPNLAAAKIRLAENVEGIVGLPIAVSILFRASCGESILGWGCDDKVEGLK